MQEFIKWGGLTPEELKARQEREWAEAIMIAEARIAAQLSSVGVGGKSDPIKLGESGKSILMTYLDPAQDEWFITCAVWPQTQPASTPYLSTPISTGISSAAWNYVSIYPVDSKGYLVSINAIGDGNNYGVFMFVDGVGTLIESITINTDNYEARAEEGIFAGVTYMSNAGLATAKLWSGGQVFTHTFPDAIARPSWNASGIGYEDCTLDGTTTIRYSSNSGTQTWMVNAITGTKFNITQHLVHSTAAGQSDRNGDGLRMYGNYMWMTFDVNYGVQTATANVTAASNQITLLPNGPTPRIGQVVSSAIIPTGTVITGISGNTLTLSQAALDGTGAAETIQLSGEFVDILRIIKTDGTVTDIDLSGYNLRGVNEVRPVGRYDLVIDSVQSEHPTIPGWVLVYRGQDGVILDESIDMEIYDNLDMIAFTDPREFRTGLGDPAGVDYVTMIVYGGPSWSGKMTEYVHAKFIWFGPDSETLCTWTAANGDEEFEQFGLYYNDPFQNPNGVMQRQVVIGKLVTGEASVITFGLDTNLCDAISVTIPTAYANMTNHFELVELGTNHVLIGWEDTSREGDIRGYQIWNRSTMEWNGQTLWLQPAGVSVFNSGSTLLITDMPTGATYYWVPAINNGNAGINILAENAAMAPFVVGEGGWASSLSSYNGFAESGVMLVLVSPTEAWVIRNQVGQTAHAISLPEVDGFVWSEDTRITYDLILVTKYIDASWHIKVLNLAGSELYTINTGFSMIDWVRTIQNRVIARASNGEGEYGLYFISANDSVFKLVTGHTLVANDWRWWWEWDD